LKGHIGDVDALIIYLLYMYRLSKRQYSEGRLELEGWTTIWERDPNDDNRDE
jgi:hypothetical protein